MYRNLHPGPVARSTPRTMFLSRGPALASSCIEPACGARTYRNKVHSFILVLHFKVQCLELTWNVQSAITVRAHKEATRLRVSIIPITEPYCFVYYSCIFNVRPPRAVFELLLRLVASARLEVSRVLPGPWR